MEQTSPKLNWKAVLVGAVVDFACTFAFSMVLVVVLIAVLAGRGVPVLEALEGLEAYLNNNSPLLILQIVVGSLCTVLGGFVAAHLARGAEMSSAVGVGGVGILLGIAMLPLGQSPLWSTILAFVLIVPAALLGGWLRLRMPRSGPPNKTEQEGAPPLPNPY